MNDQQITDLLKADVRISKSGAKNVFTPYRPVNKSANFVGRESLIKELVSCVSSGGRHVLLFGGRGVGKSSLSNAIVELVFKYFNGKVIRKSCDSSDGFESVFTSVLKELGVIDVNLTQYSNEGETGYEIGGQVSKITAKMSGKSKKVEVFKPVVNALSPSWVGNLLKSRKCIIVIDEFDTISSDQEKSKFAELLKYLSDHSERTTVILVGVAADAQELTSGHPSVQRCLLELLVPRMNNDEIRRILLNGFQHLGLVASEEVLEKIVSICGGYPYFAHLIGLKCAEILISDARRHITIDDLKTSLDRAAKNSESTMMAAYQKAVSGAHMNERALVLKIAANIDNDFSAQKIKDKIEEEMQVIIDKARISTMLRALSKVNDSPMFLKVSKGLYRFSDPRMASYIKMI